MKNKKFSVLLSIYKNEVSENLVECLDSIYDNSVLPNEVILVEDGPLTNDLYKTIEDYKQNVKSKSSLKTIKLEKNVGLGNALAIGLKHCSNELVARMDTDDLCNPTRFEYQLNEFFRNENLSMVGGYIEEFDLNPNIITGVRKVPLSKEEIKKYFKSRNPFNHVTVMFKKSKVLEAGNYRKVYDIGYEDYDLWTRMIRLNFEIKNINMSLVKVRTGQSMLKRRGDKKRLKTAIYFRKQMYQEGLCSYSEFLYSIIKTVGFSYAPSWLKKITYKKILRS